MVETLLHAKRARKRLFVIGAGMLALGVVALSPGVAPAAKGHKRYLCSGTFARPGVLSGNYRYGVVVKGVCSVKDGPAHVFGTLTIRPGSAMAAAFGLNARTHHGGSRLTVTGDLVVGRGATLVLGCKVNPDGSGTPCLDERSMKNPKLTSSEYVSGNLVENAPLGVVMHNSAVGGNVTQTSGGGGVNCTSTGVFKAEFKSPVFSDYEDSSVHGNLQVTGLKSCYLGVIRDSVHGTLGFTNNQLADPDAIEIEANHVGKNLSCTANSSVWDSHELSTTANFPRGPQPNTVHGKRSGQCVLSTPVTMGGPSGPGAF
ncbi:MAG: hypothetical protein ACRDNK_12195 [Solirubrobacteraceae bacterium]